MPHNTAGQRGDDGLGNGTGLLKVLDPAALSKRFCQELRSWYCRELRRGKFPRDSVAEARGQDARSLIRLVTQVIFCRFLREKGVIPDVGPDGDKKGTGTTVRGLTPILERYTFTVAENTPVEAEAALDPEVLGKVFEELLAADKTETDATARKKTGSFYTPREIVHSMVEEALIASLRAWFVARFPTATQIEGRLRRLFSDAEEQNPFRCDETSTLVEAIDHLTILDPACGSGAFLMGVLHKLVFVLGKLDPDDRLWKARQIDRARTITDAAGRARALAEIEWAFGQNMPDYGRKLYLIENCLYGVDIQPIAVEIARQRLYLALIAEQKSEDTRGRRKIWPLPSLERHLVVANALLGGKQGDQQCSCKLPVGQNASASHFDPEGVFGLRDGFDICLGNPPWVSLTGKHGIGDRENEKDVYLALYGGNTTMPNLYAYFLQRGLELIKTTGHLAFILPDRFGLNASFAELRKQLLERHSILQIVYKWRFEGIIADTMTMLISAEKDADAPVLIKNRPEEAFIEIRPAELLQNSHCSFKGFKDLETMRLVKKIESGSVALARLAKSTSGFGGKSFLISQARTTKRQIPVLKGASIGRYAILKRYYFDFRLKNLTGRTRDTHKLGWREKILLRKTGERIIAAYDDTGIYPEQSLYFLYDVNACVSPKTLLGILNSRLVSWFYQNRLITNLDSTPQLKNCDLDAIPIRLPEDPTTIIALVEEVLAAKKADPLADTMAAERAIDSLVYNLYTLTPKEVSLIEASYP